MDDENLRERMWEVIERLGNLRLQAVLRDWAGGLTGPETALRLGMATATVYHHREEGIVALRRILRQSSIGLSAD